MTLPTPDSLFNALCQIDDPQPSVIQWSISYQDFMFHKVEGLLTSLIPTCDYLKPTPNQRPTILYDLTNQIILRLRISQIWRNTHLPSSIHDFPISDFSISAYIGSTVHDPPWSNGQDHITILHFASSSNTVFDFPDLRVSEIQITCHVFSWSNRSDHFTTLEC